MENIKNMKKNLKYIIIMLFLVIIITIGGLLFYYQNKTDTNREATQNPITQNQSTTIEEANTKEINKIIDKDNEIYKSASEEGNIDKCSEMSADDQKDSCVKLIAIKLNDVALCEKINNKEALVSCKDYIYYTLAKKDNDLELCKKINEEHLNNLCVTAIISGLQYSEEKCEQLEGAQKDTCLTHVLYQEAMEKKDISICEKIPGENNIECISSVISRSFNDKNASFEE